MPRSCATTTTVFPVAPGTEGDEVAEVLARQHYVLAGWREKDRVLNYRRFFDVDGLIAIRVEEPDVFDETHRVLLDLNHRGVDRGLPDRPPRRAGRPRGLPAVACGGAPGSGTAIWVEKILEPGGAAADQLDV